MAQDDNALTIVTTKQPKSSSMRGPGDKIRQRVEKSISLDNLQQNFAQFLDSLQKIVDIKQGRVGDFLLEEITFNAEISAEGEFKLLGSGVGVAASNGVSFTLRRQEPNQVA